MITSSLQPFCCCNPTVASCDQTGKVRITWQLQLADAHTEGGETEAYCYPICNPECPPAPTTVPNMNATIGACGYTAVVKTTSEPCSPNGFAITANNSFTMNTATLDFTFKTTAFADTPPVAWIYSPDNGATLTTTCMTVIGRKTEDRYDDYVTTCWSSGGIGNCQSMTTCVIGNNPSANCGTALIQVRYLSRAYYLTAPAPFTIKAQTSGASSARYYSVELVGAVRTFRLWNAASTNIYSLDISALTLEQVRSTLDAQATIVCASLMAGTGTAQVATRALTANLIQARAFVPIPTTSQVAVGVGLFAPGLKTELWQVQTMCPNWTTSVGGALIRNDAQPNLAFSAGYDEAAELMFCMGFETIVNVNTEGATANWWNAITTGGAGFITGGNPGLGGNGYAPDKGVPWDCFTNTFTSPSAPAAVTRIVMAGWGSQPVPLGEGTSTPVTSTMVNETYLVVIATGGQCDFPTECACCPNEDPMFDGINSSCGFEYIGSSYITQGMFRVERIV